jgi:hypothetical protein
LPGRPQLLDFAIIVRLRQAKHLTFSDAWHRLNIAACLELSNWMLSSLSLVSVKNEDGLRGSLQIIANNVRRSYALEQKHYWCVLMNHQRQRRHQHSTKLTFWLRGALRGVSSLFPSNRSFEYQVKTCFPLVRRHGWTHDIIHKHYGYVEPPSMPDL